MEIDERREPVEDDAEDKEEEEKKKRQSSPMEINKEIYAFCFVSMSPCCSHIVVRMEIHIDIFPT